MEKRRVNILHISDFHHHKDRSHDHKIVVDAFISDLKSLLTTDLAPNLVAFSGDLVQNRDDCSNYYDVLNTVMYAILETINLNENHIFLTPSNHDV